MAVKIEALFTELTGAAPDRRSVDKIMRAGRAMKLQDHDAFWLVMVAFEAQQAEVARTLAAAQGLADAADTAASKADAAAAKIRKIVVEGAQWFQEKLQDATFPASEELTGAIGFAAGAAAETLTASAHKAAETIAAATQEATDRANADVGAKLDQAGRRAVDNIASAVANIASSTSAATWSLNRAADALKNQAEEAGDATVAKWAHAVNQAAEKMILEKSERELNRAGRRTLVTIAITMIVTVVSFIGVWETGHGAGYRTGFAIGEQINFDAKERASWANTSEGLDAYRLAETGSLAKLVSCTNPGWRIEKKDAVEHCYPDQTPDGMIHGWRLNRR